MKRFLFCFFFIAFSLSLFSQTYTLRDKWVDCGNGCQLLDPYYSEGVTFSWNGSSKAGKANGYGTAIKYVNGEYESTYVGEYKDGIREGKGKFTHKDGSTKTGSFINGQLIGHGTMESDNGSSYEGDFINYRFHGKGKIRWGNGSVFEGFIVSDTPYSGKFTNYDGSVQYIHKGIAMPKDSIKERRSGYSPQIGIRQREYFDKNWNRCQAKNASFYRMVTYEAPNKPKGIIRDYYISGELQSEFTAVYIDYDDEGKNFHEGEAKWYYKNGKIEQTRFYFNNNLNGPNIYYFENGKVQMQQFFNFGSLDGDMIIYNDNGKPRIIAKYDNGNLKNNKFLQIEEDGTSFLVYRENFERNADTWQYQGQNGTIGVYQGGSAILSPAPGRTVSNGIDINFTRQNENIIEFVVSQNTAINSSVGILFGFKDWENYCAIYVSGNKYLFRYMRNGKKMTNEEWTYSESIKSDINQIAIANTQKGLLISINEQQIWESQSIQYMGTFCGVTADNNSTGEAYAAVLGLSVYEVVTDNENIAEYLPSSPKTSDGEWESSGSGFFIDINGYIATNYHVIENSKQIEVSFVRNGEWEHHPASVVLSDRQNDLSILKIEGDKFKPYKNIPYNFTTNIKDTGTEVFTLGYPIASVMGTEVKFTDGKISSKTGIQGDVTVYQISVPIQPGNSGGPLFDNHGNLVGITSSGLNRDYFKAENVNYAIKSSYLKSLIDSLPTPIELQTTADISNKPLTEKIKLFQGFMTYIKVK